MAIQMRRGAYSDLDPTALLPGEWATVLSGDPGSDDGLAVYLCFSAGTVKRMATYDGLYDQIAEIEESIVSGLTSIVEQAAQEAYDAAADAGNYGQRLSTLEQWAFNVGRDWPDVEEMQACCEQVQADLTNIAALLAPLASTWLVVGETFFAPSAAAFSVSGNTATVSGTVSDETLTLT